MTGNAVTTMTAGQSPHGVTLGVIQTVSFVALAIHVPAIVQIAGALDASPAAVSSTIGGYLLVGAMLQLAFGSLSDFLGRRVFTLLALAGFSIASFGCAVATDIAVFAAFRALQGVATVLAVQSRAIVADTRDEDQAASLLGYISGAMAVVTMVAPLAGGVMAQTFGWQAPFLFCALLGVVAFGLCWRALPETIERRNLTSSGLLSAFGLALSSGRFMAYALSIAGSLATYYVFITAAPVAADGAIAASEAALGLFLTTMTLGFLAGSVISGRASTRIGAFATALFGRAVSMAGLLAGCVLLLAWPVETFWLLALPVFFAGMGDGITVPAATGAMLSGKRLPAGTGAAVSGVMVLLFGAVVSLGVGRIASGGLSLFEVCLLMLVPASAAIVPLMLVRKRQD